MKIISSNGITYILYDEFSSDFLATLINQTDVPSGLKNEEIKVGLEFEFYIGNGTQKSYEENLNFLVKNQFSHLFPKLTFLQSDHENEKDIESWYLERDDSLSSFPMFGHELVSPILSIKEAYFYIETITQLIDEFGFTNNECGFHIHLSSPTDDKINPSAMCLTSKSFFASFPERGEYDKNLFKKFDLVSTDVFDAHFHDLSKNMTIASRCDEKTKNHIELRAFGGKNYQKKGPLFLKILENFINNSYKKSCNTDFLMTDEYKQLKKEHNIKCNNKNPLTFASIQKDIDKMFEEISDTQDRIEMACVILNEYDKLQDKFVPFCELLTNIIDYEKTYSTKNAEKILEIIDNKTELTCVN
jgi:hypothetical protein